MFRRFLSLLLLSYFPAVIWSDANTVIAVYSVVNTSFVQSYVGGVIRGTFKIGEATYTIFDNVVNPLLEDLPTVHFAQDIAYQLASNWGLNRINHPDLPLTNNYYTGTNSQGAGVDVYVIDSGIEINHPDFGGRAFLGGNFANDGIENDCYGHGTHVAGIVMSNTWGVAKIAQAISVRVVDCYGNYTYTSNIIQAMVYALNSKLQRRHPSVILLALQGAYDSFLNDFINVISAQGITIVAAAGNTNNNACFYSPSSASNTIVVASSGMTDQRSWFSGYGTCVDVFAPGENIESTDLSLSSSIMSGTSMAAAHVAGIAAQILSDNPNFSPYDVQQRIYQLSAKNKILDGGQSIYPIAQVSRDCILIDSSNCE